MQNQHIKTLEEVRNEINESLGVLKKFSPKSGFYNAPQISPNDKGYRLQDTKVHKEFSFKEPDQSIAFGHFKSKKGYNSKLANNKEYANHYGEYIGFLILKQLGKKACKVDMGEADIIFPYNKKVKTIEGVLSYIELTQQESLNKLGHIVGDYKSAYPKRYKALTKRGYTNSEYNYTNIEIALEAMEEYYKRNNQEHRIPEMRKSFFDMCMFDIKFANRDRHDDNFGLKINDLTGEINYYPLFDNEQILGMQEEKSAIEKYLSDDTAYKEFKSRELTSCIGIPGKTQKIPPMELLTYLLENYYEETKASLEDIGRYSLENLEEVLDVCPGLSSEHKEFAKKIFVERQKEIQDTVFEFEEKRKLSNVGVAVSTDDDHPEL